MISEILHLMPVEIAVCTGELTGELAASQKSSLVMLKIIANVSATGGFVIH